MSTLSSRRRLTTGGDLPDSHHKLSRRADGTTRRLTTSLEGGTNIDDSFQQELEMVYTSTRRGNNNTNINSMNAIEIREPRYHGPPSRNNNNRWRGMITCKATSILLAVSSVLVYLCIPATGSSGSSIGGDGSTSTKQPLISGFNTATYDEPPPFDEGEDQEPPPPLNEQHQDSLIAAQFTTDRYANQNHMDMILSAELGLAGLPYHPTSFASSPSNDEKEKETSYTGVYGEFCVFNTQLNKDDPSYFPTIKDVMSESAHCGEHRYTISLNDVMDAINNKSRDIENNVKTLPLSGMLFHQGYSGAGLISNALTALANTVVVAEHAALHSALSACDSIHSRYKTTNCSSTKQHELVKDIIKLLSRTRDMNAEHLFLKLESASAAYLSTLIKLYPNAKWTFSYRDAEETLSKSMQRKRNVPCMKARRNPTSALSTKAQEKNLDLEKLSHHEICALHLSTLLEAAINEHNASGTGMLVSYIDIMASDVIVDEVLPYLGLDIDSTMKDRITDILSTRSNTRESGIIAKGMAWDTSQEENIEIIPEVHDAVKTFMAHGNVGWDDEM